MGKIDSDIQQLLPLEDLALPADGLPPAAKRVYCNRNLRFDQIQMVGFDMDYTLAVYRQEAMDRLSIQATAHKLVDKGYPAQLKDMKYQPHFPIRGLLVDKKLGNILKTDRYRYPKKAYHGLTELSSDERRQLYATKRIRPGTPRYHSIDTLYALSEVAVYAAVVDALDGPLSKLDYAQLFEDVRSAIDEAHRDGSIKDQIVADLPAHIHRDDDLPRLLHKLRSAGKKLFLLTNSEAHYTATVMAYLLDGALPEYRSWKNYFDIIIAEAAKPRFFTEDRKFVDATTAEGERPVALQLSRDHIYCGGSLAEFRRLTKVRGDRILYVGDHIFGDVLRAKKDSAWRTLMIIQEMHDELVALDRFAQDVSRMDRLEQRRYVLQDGLRDRQAIHKSLLRALESGEGLGQTPRVEVEAASLRLRRSIDKLRIQIKRVEAEHLEIQELMERAYHPFWGSFFKAGSELSSFGEQVERYACLYTDQVTNLLHYSPSHYFRGPRHRMAHE